MDKIKNKCLWLILLLGGLVSTPSLLAYAYARSMLHRQESLTFKTNTPLRPDMVITVKPEGNDTVYIYKLPN